MEENTKTASLGLEACEAHYGSANL